MWLFWVFVFFVLILALGVALGLLKLLYDSYQQLQLQHKQGQEQLSLARQQIQRLEDRFRPIVNLDSEAHTIRAEIARLKAEHQQFVQDAIVERQGLLRTSEDTRARYEQLRHEVSILEESLEDLSYGIYKPHYEYDTAERFRQELDRLRDAKKQMVRKEQATQFSVGWQVNGSLADGAKMQKQFAKLMLRAFNGEADATLANVRWNNITRMEERILKSFEAVNKAGLVVNVAITPAYMELAVQELRLQFEYDQKKHEEAEEQRRIKERMREEERAQRELKRAEEEAALDETRYEKALIKARAEVSQAKGDELLDLNQRIQELQQKLAEAQAKGQRAIAMAQLTRCGYVYIISNLGSFGENVYKIGMTRREDPMDRVKELGDASVPFEFDVHAMVYTDDAPALERALHVFFDHRRINLVNPRKEFFEVGIHEIQGYLAERGLQIELTKLAEAREFRQTLSMRGAKNGSPSQPPTPALAVGGTQRERVLV